MNHMNRILVIADDLSGAAEIAGIGVQHGLRARICRGALIDDRSADLIVIDTDTRHHSADDAAKIIRQLLSDFDRDAVQLIYKKTDSILRGPVAAEIDAMLKSLGIERALLAPQNPTLGRVIRGGKYLVNDVPLELTDFAKDPEHPRTSSDVRELLGGPDEAIRIASGESVEDLKSLASQIDLKTLPAGGADFFVAILETRGLKGVGAPVSVEVSGGQLFVCGSAAVSSRQLVSMAAARGATSLPMPLQLCQCENLTEQMVEEWSDQICAALRSNTRVIMSVGHPPLAHRARHVRQVVAATVAKTLSQCRVGTLWIEGGATAAAIALVMRWREFAV